MSAPSVAEREAHLLLHAEHGVRRISIDVLGEQVTFSLRDGRVRAQCTCTLERCEHHAAALRLFGDEAPVPIAREPRQRSSLRPPALPSVSAGQLAEALDELCLATARAGVSLPDSPSIRAALEQLGSVASDPLSLSLGRFIGRFQVALTLGDVGRLSRLLSGAQTFAAEVRLGERSHEFDARMSAWLGRRDAEAPASLTEVVLVEIGREWLAAPTRSAIERRYLVDLAQGELYCEERRRGEHDISVGPCPRVVHVAFAELETATSPARARLLQYTVTSDPSPAQWQRLAELGEAQLSALAARFANATRRCPGLAEPAVLFAPSELTAGPAGALRDAGGARLELRDDDEGPRVEALRSLVGSDQIVWVLGRMEGLARGFSLRPISVLVRTKAGLCLRRVT